MIKTKLRIAQGSILPYIAAVVAFLATLACFLDYDVTMTKFRWEYILPMAYDSKFLNIAWILQTGGLLLLAILLIVAAKKYLAVLVLPVTMYAVANVFLVLENNSKYYFLLIGALLVFYFFALMALNIIHSKFPAMLVSIVIIAGVAVLCVLGKEPFFFIDLNFGEMFDMALLIQTLGYYAAILLVTFSITEKYVAEIGEAPKKEASKKEPTKKEAEPTVAPKKEEAPKESSNWSLYERPLDASAEDSADALFIAEDTKKAAQRNEAFSVSDWLDQQEDDSKSQAAATPITGTGLQKSLKEEIVYDRDQKLMYRKKVNIFSVIGLILSVAAIMLGVVGLFNIVEIEALQDDTVVLMLFALGLCMLCVFGTRVTYKEYYTKTIVTERKVVREESNWEEFIANRLEEDERNIASLTESYAKMTAVYTRLLETTSELSNSVKALRMNPDAVQTIALEDAVKELSAEYDDNAAFVVEPTSEEAPEAVETEAFEEQALEEPAFEEQAAEEQIFEEQAFEEQVAENKFEDEFEDEQEKNDYISMSDAFAAYEAAREAEIRRDAELTEAAEIAEDAVEEAAEEVAEEVAETYEEATEVVEEVAETIEEATENFEAAEEVVEAVAETAWAAAEPVKEAVAAEYAPYDAASYEEAPKEEEAEVVLPTFRGFGYDDMDQKDDTDLDDFFAGKPYQMKPFSARRSSAYYEEPDSDEDDDMPKREYAESIKANLYGLLDDEEVDDNDAEDTEPYFPSSMEEPIEEAAEQVEEAHEDAFGGAEEFKILGGAESAVDELLNEQEDEPMFSAAADPALPSREQEEVEVEEVQSAPAQDDERRRKLQEKLEMIYRRNQEMKRAKEDFKDLEDDIIVIR